MHDPTEAVRRELIDAGQPQAALAADQSQRWNTDELQRDFEVLGFMAPFVVAIRRSDGVRGSLEFTHMPRVYYGWKEDS